MHFDPNQVYHVYNRGNDKQTIFFSEANYLFLLTKIKTEWKKYAAILCYCLMPNHFHFMLVPNNEGCKNIILGDKETHMQNLSKTIGKTLSSYTKAINIQNKTTGNLFQKKTKAKLLSCENKSGDSYSQKNYLLTCFHYIHQNPLKAKLTEDLKDWPYSSYSDYYHGRNGNVCNKSLSYQLLDFSDADFKSNTIKDLDVKIVEGLF